MKTREITHTVDKNGCHICTSHAKNDQGYHDVVIDRVRYAIHRFVYMSEFGSITSEQIVRHKCDNRSCINLEHLELGTHQDNVSDRVSRDRSAKGTANGRSKITEEQAQFILDSDKTAWLLSKMFGIDPKTVRDIKSGKIWKHLMKSCSSMVE